VAVYTARGHNKGWFDGKPFDREVRFTRVYARRDGRWQCVAAQYTPIAG
jgi:ketosteroid isomerase-like protein